LRYALYKGLTWGVWTLSLPWLAWRRATGGGEWSQRLGALPPLGDGIWVHAASVGEVSAAAPLVRGLVGTGESVMLTVMTPTGRVAAARLEKEGASVAFPPLDLPPAVDRALDAVSPRALLVVETELWPNMIVGAAARGVRVCVVNGRLSEGSVSRYGGPFFPLRDVRAAISFVACRSEEDRARFARLGFPDGDLDVTGSTKFDLLPEPPDPDARSSLRRELGVADGVSVIVFGSVRPAEEEAVLDVAASLADDGRAHSVVAPRHLRRVESLERGLRSRGLAYVTRSSGELATGGASVTVLDTTGELGRLYGAADVAFVGGTLAPYGGHNPLEPASLGVPVLVGAHTESCALEAELLIGRGGAARVRDGEELLVRVRSLLDDDSERASMGGRALMAVSSGRGATARTLEVLRKRGVLGSPEARSA